MKLKVNYEVNAQCDDCGEDIIENMSLSSTVTNGYYYLDGSVACEACHEGSR